MVDGLHYVHVFIDVWMPECAGEEKWGKGSSCQCRPRVLCGGLYLAFLPCDPMGPEVLWPEGTGEWEIIKKGNPRFEGHYQPKVPLWGYELDNDPQVMEKWIDAATDHGVNTFIFDWYWFNNGPFLEGCLNDGFLKAKITIK